MVSKARNGKADATRAAAADYFAARAHDAWRRTFRKSNPNEKDQPRMRQRGGVMVDVNQPWSKLHPKAKADNKRAAYDAYDAIRKFPNDREGAADYVHQRWMKRNKADPAQPKALFKPYADLPEIEKDKDRAHVDNMTRALAAVRSPKRKAPAKKSKRAAPTTRVGIDARAWRRLEAAARDLSAALGRPVSPEAMLTASIEATTAMCKSIAARARAKRA